MRPNSQTQYFLPILCHACQSLYQDSKKVTCFDARQWEIKKTYYKKVTQPALSGCLAITQPKASMQIWNFAYYLRLCSFVTYIPALWIISKYFVLYASISKIRFCKFSNENRTENKKTIEPVCCTIMPHVLGIFACFQNSLWVFERLASLSKVQLVSLWKFCVFTPNVVTWRH